jgi:uncharacterized protein YodC (DUF2158 family)
MTNFELGDLVTLKYHPYFNAIIDVYISADSTMTPPIMVITEVLEPTRLEENGSEEGDSEVQIKCLFYSHKTHQYESHWFSTLQMKRIEDFDVHSSNAYSGEEAINSLDNLLNKNVILKTWKVEIIKKKNSLSENTSSIKKNSKTITANLNFLPPVMTVIGHSRNSTITPEKKSLKHNRKKSTVLYKCKWFNPKSDTFSEGKFVLDTLDFLNNDEELVSIIHDFILQQKIFKFHNPEISVNKGNTIGKALKITYNHCYYELEYFDYLTNQTEIINLTRFSVASFEIVVKPVRKFAPSFSEIHIGVSVVDFIKAEILSKPTLGLQKIFKIIYIDRNDNVTVRTINNCSFHYNGDVAEVGTNIESVSKKFLKANCYKRNDEERYFSFDGIQSIELLNIERSK